MEMYPFPFRFLLFFACKCNFLKKVAKRFGQLLESAYLCIRFQVETCSATLLRHFFSDGARTLTCWNRERQYDARLRPARCFAARRCRSP